MYHACTQTRWERHPFPLVARSKHEQRFPGFSGKYLVRSPDFFKKVRQGSRRFLKKSSTVTEYFQNKSGSRAGNSGKMPTHDGPPAMMNGQEPVPEYPRLHNPARLIIVFPNPGRSTARYKGKGCIITN